MCPGEEFLPHPPNPDDIIFEEDSSGNPGNESIGETPTGDGNDREPEAPPTELEATPTNSTEDAISSS